MLQEPQASKYDLRFRFCGYDVRVAWGFGVVAAVLGWSWSIGLNSVASVVGMDSPGAPVLLLMWGAAIFLSILVHELGHSLAMTYYGTNSRIVLYHFGGLAIPDSFGSWNAARRRRIGPIEQIVISAAGPAFQLALALVFWVIGYALGVRMELMGHLIGPEKYPDSAAVFAVFNFVVGPSVFWATLNLAPILPLDGGRIMQNVLLLTDVNQPARAAHMVSVGTGVVLGLYFMTQRGNPLAGIMFFMFAANNWQAMQHGSGGF